MTRREKRKIIALLILMALVFVGSISVMIWKAKKAEEGQQGNIGKPSVVKTVQQEYDEIYYVRTSYKNQQFRVLFDSPQKDGTHWVRYTLFDDKDAEEVSEKDIYGTDVPVNTIIEEYLSDEEYKKKINGYEIFDASEDVTTIIMTKNVEVKYEEPTTVGFATTYVTSPESVPVEAQIEEFGDIMLAEDGLGEDAYLLDQTKEETFKYIKDNHFELYKKKQ